MYISDKEAQIPFVIYRLVLGTLIILPNAFLVHALRKLRKLNSVSHRFVVILSASDICIGVLLVSMSSLVAIDSEEVYQLVYLNSLRVMYFLCQFSFFMVITIATDRYIHMRFLTKYPTIMTNSRGVKVIIGVVCATVFLNAILICGKFFGFFVPAYLFYISANAVFLAVLFIQYASAYKALKRRVQGAFLEGGRAPTINVSLQRAPKKEFAKAVLLILSSALICYAPFFIYSITVYLNLSGSSVVFDTSLRGLVGANSAVNAMIFMALNRDIKRYLLSCFSRVDRREQEDQAVSSSQPIQIQVNSNINI